MVPALDNAIYAQVWDSGIDCTENPGLVLHLIYIQDGKKFRKRLCRHVTAHQNRKEASYDLEERLLKADCGLGS